VSLVAPNASVFSSGQAAGAQLARKSGFHPMARKIRETDHAVVMQSPDFSSEGAGAMNDGAGGNGMDEPLFGDARWIEERLEALGLREENGVRQEAD
jgi:hypothetical protein